MYKLHEIISLMPRCQLCRQFNVCSRAAVTRGGNLPACYSQFYIPASFRNYQADLPTNYSITFGEEKLCYFCLHTSNVRIITAGKSGNSTIFIGTPTM
jgi:hypothetical protein